VSLLGTTGTLSIASGATERVARLYLNGVAKPTHLPEYRPHHRWRTVDRRETAPSARPRSRQRGIRHRNPLEWIHASVNDTAIKVERSLAPDSVSPNRHARRKCPQLVGLRPHRQYRVFLPHPRREFRGKFRLFVCRTATTLAPSPPIGLTATPGNAQVSLSWTASGGAASYIVSRATTSGGPYTQVGFPASTTYVDSGLLYDTTYYYVVSSVAGNAVSANPRGFCHAHVPDGNGVWSAASGGNWTNATQWQNQTVAKGSGFTATFPLSAGGTITQNRSTLTIGHLNFSNGNYTLSGNPLTLDVASGTSAAFVGTGITARLTTALSGSDGLEKSGSGTLSFYAGSGDNSATSIIKTFPAG